MFVWFIYAGGVTLKHKNQWVYCLPHANFKHLEQSAEHNLSSKGLPNVNCYKKKDYNLMLSILKHLKFFEICHITLMSSFLTSFLGKLRFWEAEANFYWKHFFLTLIKLFYFKPIPLLYSKDLSDASEFFREYQCMQHGSG